MIFAGLFVLAGAVVGVLHYWDELFTAYANLTVPRHQAPLLEDEFHVPKDYLVWMVKGLAVPVFFWLLANANLLPGIPPFLAEVSLAQFSGGRWVPTFMEETVPGLMVIGIYWAAVSFAWMSIFILRHASERRELLVISAIWCLIFSPLIWFSFDHFGIAGAPLAVLIWLIPTVHCGLHLVLQTKRTPSYSQALAKIKFGKYGEAEKHVLQELEKCESDYDGWLMLAELYAHHFHELAEADAAVRTLCNDPSLTDLQITMAFHRLADWHLKCGDDPVSAGRALEEICLRLPGTHFAKMARLRLEKLPPNRAELLEERKTKTLRLPALNDELDPVADPSSLPQPMPRDEALALMNKLIGKLNNDPNDIAAREQLAITLTEHLAKVDLGIAQLELLIALPNQPPAKTAEWLGQLAVWHFRYRHDPVTSRNFLTRLVREFPQTPQAFAAQRRLNGWEIEDQIQQRLAAEKSRPIPSVFSLKS